MSVTKSFDDVMFAFSVESQQDATTLARYLKAYPQFAADFVDLAHELNLFSQLGSERRAAGRRAKAQAAWLQYAAVSRQLWRRRRTALHGGTEREG
jgi:hypothetical protein